MATSKSDRQKARRKAVQDKQRAYERQVSADKQAAGLRYLTGRVTKEVADARIAEIPADTRGLTARTFGDPIYERSALYQKVRAS